MVAPVSGIISELFQPNVWLVWRACSDKAEFFFLQGKTAFWLNCI